MTPQSQSSQLLPQKTPSLLNVSNTEYADNFGDTQQDNETQALLQ
jgi:hypothetical protein